MQFKALIVVALAGLAIATPTPEPQKKNVSKKLADRIKANERGTTKCNTDASGFTICDDFQGGICTIGKNGNGGTCLF